MAEAKPGTEVFSSAPTNSFYGLRVQFLPPKSELEKASGVSPTCANTFLYYIKTARRLLACRQVHETRRQQEASCTGRKL